MLHVACFMLHVASSGNGTCALDGTSASAEMHATGLSTSIASGEGEEAEEAE